MSNRKIFAFLVIGAFFYITYPLLLPVSMGAVLAVLFLPLLKRMENRKISTPVASILLTLGITILLLLPASVLLYQGTKSGVQQLQALKEAPRSSGDWVEAITNTPNVRAVLSWITQWFPIEMQELANTVQDLVRSIGAKAADWLGILLSQLPGMAMAIVVIVVSVYFFLVDGRKLVLFVRRSSIFTPKQTERLLASLTAICRSVLLASLVSGASQAILETIMLLFTGIPNALLLGLMVFFGSFIPVVGSAPLTFGIALIQFLQGHTAVGCILAGSALVVGTMDNFIRPWFLKGSSNLHPLLAFVAAFGGLQTMGFIGVFLGPIVAALLLTMIEVFTESEEEPLS